MPRPLLLLLPLLSLAAVGCPQDPPPAVSQAPEVEEKSAPSEETKSPAAPPAKKTEVEAADPPPEKTAKPRKRHREPLNLLDGVAKRSKVADVDVDALNRQPRKVRNRKELAEDRARNSGGRSTWARGRDGKKKKTSGRVRWKPLTKRRGAPRRAMPTMHTRPILAAWRNLGAAKKNKNWRAYFRGHSLGYQRQMTAGALSSLMNWSIMFKRGKREPPTFKAVRRRLMKYGIPASKLKLRARPGPKGGWTAPSGGSLLGNVKDLEACYTDLMKTLGRRNASGPFEGAYTPGDLAELQLTTDNRMARALLLRPGGKQAAVVFRKTGRQWVLAGYQPKR